jgi:aminopeptidase C
MNIFSFAKQYADQIGGQYTEYDNTKAIIVVPLTENRFQTVLLTSDSGKVSGKAKAVLTSKVCEYNGNIDLKLLLEQAANFDYSKFYITDGYLKIEASCPAEDANESEIKFMIQEVAKLADDYEMKLTGKDIH